MFGLRLRCSTLRYVVAATAHIPSLPRILLQAALHYVAARGCVPLPSVTTEEEALELTGAMGWEIGLDELEALHEQARK